MQVKASKWDDIAQSYNHYKIWYQRVATNSRDISPLVRLPRSRKAPSNQSEFTMLRKGVGELPKG